jgi:hypothetical protein
MTRRCPKAAFLRVETSELFRICHQDIDMPVSSVRPLKKTGAILFFLCLSPCLFAGGLSQYLGTAEESGEKTVAASTSWVAAIAEAAGARDVRVLAPVELRHPPEYELRPSDLAAVRRADIILYAGWETFAARLAETAGGAGLQLVRVQAANTPEALKAEAGRLARILGTEDRFEAWQKTFDPLAEELRQRVLAAWPGGRAVAEEAFTGFAAWLGLEVLGEYGPAEPSPALILNLVQTEPALVIDNYHAPSGWPVAEAARAAYVELINFPGKDGTKTIEDVFRYNAGVLVRAAAK